MRIRRIKRPDSTLQRAKLINRKYPAQLKKLQKGLASGGLTAEQEKHYQAKITCLMRLCKAERTVTPKEKLRKELDHLSDQIPKLIRVAEYWSNRDHPDDAEPRQRANEALRAAQSREMYLRCQPR